MKNLKRGFTLIELIVVIAILAALSALALPTFIGLIENSNRMVDVSNAKSIQNVMTAHAVDGTIVPNKSAGSGSANGFWVLVCKNGNSAPGGYQGVINDNNTVFCGTDSGVKVNGVTNGGNYLNENSELRKIFDSNFGRGSSIKSKSNSVIKMDGFYGWDWYIVEFYWDNSGSLKSKIYSGKKGENAGLAIGVGKGDTSIGHYLK